jgi:putative transposase
VSAFIEEYRERFGVEPICETLGVSASAYYQRANGQRSDRVAEDERLLGVICELHARNYYAYGSRRMWKALLRSGEKVGRSRVERLMRQNGLQGAKRRGKPWRTTRADPTALRSPDRVQRDFTASAPDEMWFADFTYLRCWEGLVFFSFVIDAYSRRIVGWQFAAHMRTTLVLDALRMALHQRQPGADVALVHHSDAGSQYTSIDYTQTLDDAGVLGSIGTVGDAYDNAVAESFVQLQDRAHRRPLLGDTLTARARRPRVRRLVQQRAHPRIPRRPATTRSRGTLRCETRPTTPITTR